MTDTDDDGDREDGSRFTDDELARLDWLGAHPHGFI